MRLRSNRVFNRGKPKISSHIKNQSFSERRLSLRSSKPKCVDCDENLEMGMTEGINSDDKGLFLGSEVFDPMEDLVVSCAKEEIGEEEGDESMSINLSETGLGFKDEVKSPHDTTIVNSDDVDDYDDKETPLDDSGNINILGKCKEMKEKGRRGRKKKKKNVGKLKKVESNQETVNGKNDDDSECTVMPLKNKKGRKRKKVGALGADCNGKATNEKLEEDGERVTVIPGLKRSDDILNEMVKDLETPPKVVTEEENMRPKKKLKSEKPCKLEGNIIGNGVGMVKGGSREVVLGLKSSKDIPKNMLKRCGTHSKVVTEGSNTRPKKKLKRRERRGKLKSEIISIPLKDIPRKKLERRGRPRKVSHEGPSGPKKSCKVEKKLDGRPVKKEAKKVKKRPKIRKNENSEGNSERVRKGERRQFKQLIKDKISNILLKCGWTIDHKVRNEKSYLDAVYIEPNGKRSFWSITGAYAKLKWKIENSCADDQEMSEFTPMPEEEISQLFRQRRKERKKHEKRTLKKVKKGKTVTGKKNVKKGKIVIDIKNVKKRKIVIDKKKKGGKKSNDGSKRKMLFKPRFLVGSKQDNEDVLVIKKRNVLSWMVDSGVILVGTKVQYGKTRRQKMSYEGVITNDGICCGCCNETMGITNFVGHCGGKFGQVFDDLYLESGVCLRKCLIDSWRKEEESDVTRFNVVDILGDDPNDDTCNVCGDGGDLICCDGCPSTFHQSCLDVENFPPGDWNCIYCTCKFCGEASVSTPQAKDSHDEVTSKMVSCCLCEEKFHLLCVQEVKDVDKDSVGLPFCRSKCHELYERLKTYLGVKHELEGGFSWTLLQRCPIDQDFNVPDTQLKIENNSKLAVAFSVMDECFVPIVDERSGTNIIHNVVYNRGSNFKRLNYAGFFTAVLEKDDEFITAASIRIHGYRLAEMPFIGTRHIYRRQGMCRRLLDAIESTLSSIGVEELIIPAIPALLQTWTDVFGFMPIEDTKKQEMKCMSMLVFPGIAMLKKPLIHNQSADVDHTISPGVEKVVIDHEQTEETILLTDHCNSPAENGENDENTPQVETTSTNTTDCKQPEKETVLMDSCSGPDLENEKLIIPNGVNSLCDLNLPVKDVLPCDINGQTSVDSESFPDSVIPPSSLESVVCGNPEMSELKLDVEDDGVPAVKVNPSPLTSNLVLKNTFDLNLQPTAVETDVHIISDDSVQSESRPLVKSFEDSESRSQVDQSPGSQTDNRIYESQPLVIVDPIP